MNGFLMGVAMLVSSAGVSPAQEAPPALVVAPPAFTFSLPDDETLSRWSSDARTRRQAPAAKRHSTTDRVIAIAAGVALGWVAGGAVGYYATQDRERDDDGTSGFKGLIIGAPIGAAVGAIVGWRLTRN